MLFASAAESSSIFNGRIVNGSRENEPVSHAHTVLQRISSNMQIPQELDSQISDAQGSIRFITAEVDTNFTYFITTEHQGIQYYSNGDTPNPLSPTQLNLVIYDTTHSTADLQILMHHVIIEDEGNSLSFRETRVMNNKGNRSITPTDSDNKLQNAWNRYPIPSTAESFSPLSGHAPDELVRRGNDVYNRGVFPPGNKTISFSYKIPFNENSLALELSASTIANSFDLFVGSSTIRIESLQLSDYGAFTIRGKSYNRYGTTDLTNPQIFIRIIRMGENKSPRPMTTILFTALLLTLGIILATLIKMPAKDKDKVDLSTLKNDLIREIAEINSRDHSAAKGVRRQELMQKLIDIELLIRQNEKKHRKNR